MSEESKEIFGDRRAGAPRSEADGRLFAKFKTFDEAIFGKKNGYF
jgi:hypothetical protein